MTKCNWLGESWFISLYIKGLNDYCNSRLVGTRESRRQGNYVVVYPLIPSFYTNSDPSSRKSEKIKNYKETEKNGIPTRNDSAKDPKPLQPI